MDGEIELWSLKRFGRTPIRFDWFGSVKRSSRSGTVQPYLSLSCSVIGDPAEGMPGKAPDKKLLSIEVLIQWLRLFRLGDVWQGGRFAGSEPLERVTFEGLVIDDSTTSVGPCGKSSEGPDGVRRHDLPFSSFSRHVDHTLAYLVRVEVGPNLVMLVPSMELVRFYFGSSGALLGNIFSGAFAKDRLYTAESKNASTGVANITLAKNVPAMAATTVARIAFNSVARRQFGNIVNTGVRAAASGEPWYPRVSFPFIGATDLTTEGVWLAGAPERVFLAFRLISCTHPFPFTKLYYKVDAETISKLVSRPASPPKEGKDERKSNDVSVRAAPQDSSLAPALVAPISDGDLVPFPDLLTKPVARVKSDSAGRSSGKPKPASGGEEASGLAHGFNREGANRPVEISESPAALDTGIDEPDSLKTLREATVSTVSDLTIRASSPMDSERPSARLEVRSKDGMTLAVWVSRLTFMPGHESEKSLVVMVAEDRPSQDSPEVVVFDPWPDPVVDQGRLVRMAQVFWTLDEERDEVADEQGWIGTWTSEQLTAGGGIPVLQELMQHVLQSEWASLEPANGAGEPPLSVEAVQATGLGSEGRTAKFIWMFGRYEDAIAKIGRRKLQMADREEDGHRAEPDWWAFARQANDVVPLAPGSELTAAVERLSSSAEANGAYRLASRVDDPELDDSVERALHAIRRLRNRVVHRQEKSTALDGGTDGEMIMDAITVLSRYLDYDYKFLSVYEESAETQR